MNLSYVFSPYTNISIILGIFLCNISILCVTHAELTVITEGVTCYADGQLGEYTTLSHCQHRYRSSIHRPSGVPHSTVFKSGLVCCKIVRKENENIYPYNGLGNEEIYREIENISDLKEQLEKRKNVELGRKKHSIDASDYRGGNRIQHPDSSGRQVASNLISESEKITETHPYDTADWYISTVSPHKPRTTTRKLHTVQALLSASTEDYYYTQRPLLPNNPRPSSLLVDNVDAPYRPSHSSTNQQWQQPLIEDENGYPIFTVPVTTAKSHENKKKLKMTISEKKCKEYSEIVQETVAGLPLLTNPRPVKFNIDKCNYNAQQLIVGGQNASLGEFPHMAAIGFVSDGSRTVHWNCGGSLISENFVLTAAHCTTSRLGAPSLVRIGDHNLAKDDDGAYPVQYHVKQVVRNPNYRPHSRYHDIALLRLSRSVTFTPHIRPACLYQKSTFNNDKTVAAGWGRMAYHEEQSDVLLKVVLSIINNDKCNELYRVESATEVLNRGIISEQMCAGELTGGKDTCQGDSGGPIEVTSVGNQCVHYIIGVTSFGKKCGQPNAPGVYTRVSSYINWIEQVVWPQ